MRSNLSKSDMLARSLGNAAESVMLRQAARIAELEAALRGIVGHWYEFAEMMIDDKTSYGLSERIDAAAKLVQT